jgi:hypothetical protein
VYAHVGLKRKCSLEHVEGNVYPQHSPYNHKEKNTYISEVSVNCLRNPLSKVYPSVSSYRGALIFCSMNLLPSPFIPTSSKQITKPLKRFRAWIWFNRILHSRVFPFYLFVPGNFSLRFKLPLKCEQTQVDLRWEYSANWLLTSQFGKNVSNRSDSSASRLRVELWISIFQQEINIFEAVPFVIFAKRNIKTLHIFRIWTL